MKDSRATRTSKLPQYLVKRESQKLIPDKERKRANESLKSRNVYGGDDAS